jgi:hypothetical protein
MKSPERWIRLGTKEWRRQFLLEVVSEALDRNAGHFDNVSAVITAGTVFESFVVEMLGNPPERIAFAAAVSRAASKGPLPKQLERPLLNFAEFRNEVAHDPNHRITARSVEFLRKGLSKTQRAELDSFLAQTEANGYKMMPATKVRCFIAWLGDDLESASLHDGSDPL